MFRQGKVIHAESVPAGGTAPSRLPIALTAGIHGKDGRRCHLVHPPLFALPATGAEYSTAWRGRSMRADNGTLQGLPVGEAAATHARSPAHIALHRVE
ncbi:MAG: hypothetical protein PVSMB4_04580 [Ktedonobacterales bacterium]